MAATMTVVGILLGLVLLAPQKETWRRIFALFTLLRKDRQVKYVGSPSFKVDPTYDPTKYIPFRTDYRR